MAYASGSSGQLISGAVEVSTAFTSFLYSIQADSFSLSVLLISPSINSTRQSVVTLSAGDTLVVWKLDRLGRSMRHLVILVEELRERGINFRSLTDLIDTSTPMGRFFFHVMGALAEMERELIVERTRAGFAAARQEGRNGVRKPKLTVEQWEQAGRLIESGIYQQQVALIYDLGISTVYKKFPVASKP
ncbi:DNA-invertase [Escherichia coli]|nr:DNA-invertase [Escherichia coli]MBB7331767.1 recombinase family protein [Escherichia coli]